MFCLLQLPGCVYSLLHHFRDQRLLFQLLRYLPVPIFPQSLTCLASPPVLVINWPVCGDGVRAPLSGDSVTHFGSNPDPTSPDRQLCLAAPC